ncbi:MAG: MoxR family ATPase [Clostridia bacterium]
MSEYFSIPHKIIDNMEKVIIGKRGAIELVVISLLAQGHILIEDVPGIGKTSMVSALAKSLGLKFKRIQFTPDILPSDITGFSMYNRNTGEFEYRPGNIMSNIILADEINRTSPKTQASMLEVMEEYQVTVDGRTYGLPEPFMVLATQNPIEYIGTYPLPEAQLDRFLMRISIGYPSIEDEIKIISRNREKNPLDDLAQVADRKNIFDMQTQVKKVQIKDTLTAYIVNIITKTRKHEHVSLGCSPRASLFLAKASQALAFMEERDYVTPDDIQKVAVPVLSHRIILHQEARIKDIKPESIIEEIIEMTKTPIRKPK